MSYNDYSLFSSHYDAFMGNYQWLLAPFEKALIQFRPLKNISADKTLLDLGCGTGTFLENALLIAGPQNLSGAELTGVDICASMIAQARAKKIIKSKFIECDIRDLSNFNGKKFNVITCTFDTLNHISDYSDWQKIFKTVASLLDEEGLFFFDINTIERFKNLCKMRPVLTERDDNFISYDISRINRNKYNWNVKIFQSDKSSSDNIYRLKNFNIIESAYDIKNVSRSLKKLFDEIWLWNADNKEYIKISPDLFMKYDDIVKSGKRLFAVCLKQGQDHC